MLIQSYKLQAQERTFVCGTSEPEPTTEGGGNISNDSSYLATLSEPKCQWIRVHYHFFMNSNGTGNFNENGDGNGNFVYNGYKRAEQIIDSCNIELEKSETMWLPNGPKPVFHPTFRYLLTGVYFHRDNNFVSVPVGVWTIHSTYGLNTNNTVNWYDVKNQPYNGGFATGEANTSANTTGSLNGITPAAKVSTYQEYLNPNNSSWSKILAAQTMNHEMGHLLGLNHTWTGFGGCNDTPPNPNCWADTPTGLCSSWANISNNIMDYNQWFRHAYSLCQIQRTNTTTSNPLGFSPYIFPSSGCCKPAHTFFDARTNTCSDNIYAQASACVNDTYYKVTLYRTSNATSTNSIGTVYNSPWLAGPAGMINMASLFGVLGFPTASSTNNPLWYYISITTKGKCNDTHTQTRNVSMGVHDCPSIMGNDFPNTSPINITNVVVSPNPTPDQVEIDYEVLEEGLVSIYLLDGIGNPVREVQVNENQSIGTYTKTLDLTELNTGLYTLLVSHNGTILYKTILKI